MGIKDLYSIISKHAPEGIGRVPITHYRGKKIAIDGHNWMYANMFGARKISARKTNFAVDKVDNALTRKEWVELCLKFIIKWLNFGVTPIFVFDGTDKPEKGETQKARSESSKQKRDVFEEKIKQMNELDILDRTVEMINEVQNDFAKFIDLAGGEIENLINILDISGLPWYQAKGESEQLCAMLALEGKVDAVYSKDGDNMVLGCPILLKSYSTNMYENGQTIPTLEFYELAVILNKLELSMDEFVDLCILLGCDFNKRIAGWGPVNAFKLIKEHRSIEKIEEVTGKDISCLNYKGCLANFSRVDSNTLIVKGKYNLEEPDLFNIRDILEANGVSILTKGLCGAMAECYGIGERELELAQNAAESSKPKARKIKIVRVKKV